MRLMACAITGHRPSRFRFKYNEKNADCKRLKKRLHDQFILLYELGVRRFYIGGALGVDMWAGEILLKLKEQQEYSDIELVEALPFEGHDDMWDAPNRQRLAFLKEHSEFVTIIGKRGVGNAYLDRNRYMVDQADYVLAVYDNNRKLRSGTGMIVHYAEKKGLPIILIHPDTGIVSKIGKK